MLPVVHSLLIFIFFYYYYYFFYFILFFILFFLFYFFIYFFFLECRFNGEVGIFHTYMLKIFNPCVNPDSHFPSLRCCVWTGVQCGSKTKK